MFLFSKRAVARFHVQQKRVYTWLSIRVRSVRHSIIVYAFDRLDSCMHELFSMTAITGFPVCVNYDSVSLRHISTKQFKCYIYIYILCVFHSKHTEFRHQIDKTIKMKMCVTLIYCYTRLWSPFKAHKQFHEIININRKRRKTEIDYFCRTKHLKCRH